MRCFYLLCLCSMYKNLYTSTINLLLWPTNRNEISVLRCNKNLGVFLFYNLDNKAIGNYEMCNAKDFKINSRSPWNTECLKLHFSRALFTRVWCKMKIWNFQHQFLSFHESMWCSQAIKTFQMESRTFPLRRRWKKN